MRIGFWRRAAALALAMLLFSAPLACSRAQRSPERGGSEQGEPGQQGQQGQRGGGQGRQGGGQARPDTPVPPNPDVASGIEAMVGSGSSAVVVGNAALIAPAGGGAEAPVAGPNRGFTGPGDLGMRVRSQYPHLAYVYLITEPTMAAQLAGIAQDLDRGGSIAAHIDALARMIKTVPPQPTGSAARGTGGAGGAGAPAGGAGGGRGGGR